MRKDLTPKEKIQFVALLTIGLAIALVLNLWFFHQLATTTPKESETQTVYTQTCYGVVIEQGTNYTVFQTQDGNEWVYDDLELAAGTECMLTFDLQDLGTVEDNIILSVKIL